MTSEGYVYCHDAASLLSVCVKQQISPLDTLTFTLILLLTLALIFTLTLALTFTLGFVLVNQWLWIGLPLVIGWLTGGTQKGRLISNRPYFRLFSLKFSYVYFFFLQSVMSNFAGQFVRNGKYRYAQQHAQYTAYASTYYDTHQYPQCR